MSHEESSDPMDATEWLQRFEAGDESAAEQVVDVFYIRLVRFARSRLAKMPPQVADDEGAVISALRSFFSGIQQGKFSRIGDEQDLWKILATITARKAIRQLRVHWKQRGPGGNMDRVQDVSQLLSSAPTPDQDAMLRDELERCLNSVTDPMLAEIVAMKLEGSDNREIAERLQVHVRSVQRKLKLIESQWLDGSAGDA